MNLDQEKKSKKYCKKGDLACFYRYNDGRVVICPNAPCKNNKKRFGQHTRIIEYYLSNEQWDLAYYYVQDLLPMFYLQCDLDLLKDNVKDSEKLPPGCKIFIVSSKLFDMKNQLLKFQRIESDIESSKIKEQMSEKGKYNYAQLKIDYAKLTIQNLERLKHMVMDVRKKYHDEDRYFEQGIIFLDKAIKAKEKYNIDIPMPSIVEERFKAAAAGPIIDPEQIKRQIKNQEKLKEAKNKSLIEKITKEFAENGKLSKETEEEFLSLQGDLNSS